MNAWGPIALTATAGALAHGAFYRNSAVFGRAIGRLPGDAKRVALTFDDGPNPVATPEVLAVLRRERVPATFFLLGRHVDRWPELAREAAHDGHELGNHGYAHRRLTFRSPAYVRADVLQGADAIERAAHVRPRFFRSPHGFRNPWVGPIVRAAGQRMVGWSLGVWDSEQPPAPVIADRVLSAARAGMILLLHDGDGYDPGGNRHQTAAALPRIIDGLRERGFAFVSLGGAV
jgi:peptidoglycan/xylan/chitin deacetylase (PgdA/CDA1 family)